MEKVNLSPLAARWPSSLVAREKIAEFTGGILTPKTMANLDSSGFGVEGRITVGRKIAYPVDLLIAWLEARANRRGEDHV